MRVANGLLGAGELIGGGVGRVWGDPAFAFPGGSSARIRRLAVAAYGAQQFGQRVALLIGQRRRFGEDPLDVVADFGGGQVAIGVDQFGVVGFTFSCPDTEGQSGDSGAGFGDGWGIDPMRKPLGKGVNLPAEEACIRCICRTTGRGRLKLGAFRY